MHGACQYYGFHALRRGYAMMNADSMPSPVVQKTGRQDVPEVITKVGG